MALDKITNKNFLSKGAPYIQVYSGWYNTMVDYLNNLFQYIDYENGELVLSGASGVFPAPLCMIPANNFKY